MRNCSVCGTYHDAQMWLTLPLIGVVKSEEDGQWYRTEMRNCPCGSTLATEEKINSFDQG